MKVWRPSARETQADHQSDASPKAHLPAMELGLILKAIKHQASAGETQGMKQFFSELGKASWEKISGYMDTDRALQLAMSSFIELAASRYAIDPGAQWEEGEPLRVLLAGYSGTRNTGADVRVEEMIRQFRHLFGDEHLELSIFTIDPALTRGYFRTVRQLKMPVVFPRFLFETIHEQHAVVACEGSMFKSKFANALSTMMVGALGLASAEGKLAIGYGGEAGAMDDSLRDLVRRYCKDALIIARNDHSQSILAELGVASRSGTDTAWTFDPAPAEVGREILRAQGWDGERPLMALVPINPFWWPVKPDVPRAAVNAFSGLYSESHWGSVYFHADGAEIDDQQEAYLDAFADAMLAFMDECRGEGSGEGIMPALFGSEQLDRLACEALHEKLVARLIARGEEDRIPLRADGSRGFPIVVSDEHDMYAMVSAMRTCRYMVASRYHAIVMSMAGGVVSAGVTMDERIRNLMLDRGTPELALEVSDPDLKSHLLSTMRALRDRETEIRVGIDRCVYANLERMGMMGQVLVDAVRERHPAFPFRPELGTQADGASDVWAHLPALPPAVEALVARVEAGAQA